MKTQGLEKLGSFLLAQFHQEDSQTEDWIQAFLQEDSGEEELKTQGAILFLAGEYQRNHRESNIIGQPQIQNRVQQLVSKCASYLEGKQNKTWQLLDLGAVYGGLRNINLFLKEDQISQLLLALKAHVFKHYILKGQLCSNVEKTETRAEMLLVCVPFGLFEPEDLVLVEASKVILKAWHNQQLDDQEKLYLAWYYLEQGTYEYTRQLLKEVTHKNDLYQLIYDQLSALGQIHSRLILHEPLGNDNRYEPKVTERFPKEVMAGERVVFKVISNPMAYDDPVFLSCDGQLIEGELIDNQYWQFKAGPFNPNQKVTYHFFFSLTPEIKTPDYSFTVGRLKSKHAVLGYQVFLKGSDSSGKQYSSLDTQGLKLITQDLTVTYGIEVSSGNLFMDIESRTVPSGDEEGTMQAFIPIKLSQNFENDDYQLTFNDNDCYLTCHDYCLKIDLGSLAFEYSVGSQRLLKSAGEPWLTTHVIENEIMAYTCHFTNENERFYGFGERYNALNQSGQKVDQYVYNQYKEQGLRTYFPMPFFISSAGYGVNIDSEAYSIFDLGSQVENTYSLRLESNQLRLQIMPGTYQEVIQQHARISGYPEMLPKWALGPWMSSNNWDSDKEVRYQVQQTLKHEIPATVLVIEAWSDESTFYIFNDAKYAERDEGIFQYDDFEFPEWGRWPDPKGLISYLHKNNLKCILWQIPIIKQITSLHHLQKENDEAYFLKHRLGVYHPDGRPYRIPEGWFKDSLLLDFTNEEASKWWMDKRRYLIDEVKIDGFKTDGGEFVFGRDLVFSDGRSGRQMRNAYPNQYIEAYYKLAKENDGMTFSRAGYSGANQMPAHWAGDERSTFEAFKRSIIAGLSAGLSGIPFWGWDLGGFSGDVPSAELFIRSSQMATFCPIMQYHAESKGEFNQDRTPWNIADRSKDPRALSVYRYYANLRMNLIPYIYMASKKACETGEPLMRAMLIDYPEDSHTDDIWNQYMFGQSFLVAPIIYEGHTSRSVYFPEGKWMSFFTGDTLIGPCWQTVTAQLEEIPLFIKSDSVIPLHLNHDLKWGEKVTHQLNRYESLCFRITGWPQSPYIFEDDLGNRIELIFESFSHTEGQSLLSIEVKKQSQAPLVESRIDTIHFIFDSDVECIRINRKCCYLDSMDYRLSEGNKDFKVIDYRL